MAHRLTALNLSLQIIYNHLALLADYEAICFSINNNIELYLLIQLPAQIVYFQTSILITFGGVCFAFMRNAL